MQIRYNRAKIAQLLGDLSNLTGISISFLDTEYNRICQLGDDEGFCAKYQKSGNEDSCCESDLRLFEKCKKSGVYEWCICPAGLYDAAMPVVKDGITVGHIIMGRIRHTKSPETALPSFENGLSRLYEKLPVFTDEQLESLKNLLPNILFSKAIIIEKNTLFSEIEKYIDEHITDDLSVTALCDKFFISKNALYACFKENCNSTVGELVTEKRLDAAKRLLKETTLPVCTVAEKSGIENYSYFCRLFKRKCGTTPREYRNTAR